jgi:LysM repeat protein
VTIAVLIVRSGLADDQATPVAPPATTAATTTAATTTQADPPATTTTDEGTFYEIESGDTLETIAAEHGTTVEQLLVLNPDVDPVALTIGQRIRVG